MKAEAGPSRGYVSPGSPVRPVVSLLVVSALLAAATLSVLPFF